MQKNRNEEDFSIRFAEKEDVSLILSLIKELAEYEEMLTEVTATEEILKANLFEKKTAEVIIGEYQGEPVAFALFYSSFSTFLGKPGLYLEDLYVRPDYRGSGFGQQLITYLADLTCERGYERLEWVCLDWNTSAIQFYRKMGATAMDDWTTYRLHGSALKNLSNRF